MNSLIRLLRILVMLSGGVIMALALLLFFAWLLFPTDFVRHLPEKALSRVLPQWQWQIGSVHYGWPLALRLEQVEARSPGRGAEPVEALFIDSLTFWPDLFLYMREQEWRGTFAAELAGGALHGNGALQTDNNRQELVVSASFDAVNLTALGWLAQVLERQVQGRLSGTVDARLALQSLAPADLQASLQVADGTLPLRNPVLEHERLPFTKLILQLEQKGQSLFVKNGILDSPLCTGEFAGVVELARPVATSVVSVRGAIQAQPELFAHVRDQKELQALRLQAAQGPFLVMLSGTMHDPALAFEREALPFNPPLSPNQE